MLMFPLNVHLGCWNRKALFLPLETNGLWSAMGTWLWIDNLLSEWWSSTGPSGMQCLLLLTSGWKVSEYNTANYLNFFLAIYHFCVQEKSLKFISWLKWQINTISKWLTLNIKLGTNYLVLLFSYFSDGTRRWWWEKSSPHYCIKQFYKEHIFHSTMSLDFLCLKSVFKISVWNNPIQWP